MSDMDAPVDLRLIRREHEPIERIAWPGNTCTTCQGQDWPCDAARLADEVERLRATLAKVNALCEKWEGLSQGPFPTDAPVSIMNAVKAKQLRRALAEGEPS